MEKLETKIRELNHLCNITKMTKKEYNKMHLLACEVFEDSNIKAYSQCYALRVNFYNVPQKTRILAQERIRTLLFLKELGLIK